MRTVLLLTWTALAAACSLRNVGCGVPEQLAPQQSAEAQTGAAAPAEPGGGPSGPFRIVFLGDSLTAGAGLLSNQAYPAILEELFAAEGYDVETLNAGISGDTTAGGLRRVEQFLTPQTRVLVVALGGNDALRGLTAAQTRDNLTAIIEAAEAKGITVVLAGMEAPTNYGDDYRTAFRGAFAEVASKHRKTVTFIPFLLEGVAAKPELNQEDGIHPNPQGARAIAELIYPRIRTVVDTLGGAG
jgi:acyl-CoA thioesterase-1